VKDTSLNTKKGQITKKNKEPRLWLLPEEALWLIERGTLEIRWPADKGEAEEDGLPMSLQAAYAVFIGMEKVGGLTLEEYTVYQYLKRSGYIVLRARDNYSNVPNYTNISSQWPIFTPLWKRMFSQAPPALTARGKTGPLVQPGLYRSYDDIYRMLTLISSHDPKSNKNISPGNNDPTAPNVTYHVYKARPGYKKTAPGPPDFYFSVINARQTSLPTEPQIDALLRQTPYHPPDPKSNLYKKLKEGFRNVILAIVDQGVTSFIDVSDSGFGQEKLWGREKKPFRGGKRGGKGGGRGGRGRGRGRGS
jgi:tRNA-splicing endonuclease subunit Sen54